MIQDILSGMKHYVFADAENSASNISWFADFLKSNNYLSTDTQIICIIGADKSQNGYYENLKAKIGAQKSVNLTPVRINESSKNAVDMVLSAYLGMAVALSPSAEFVIVSNDRDYSSVTNRFSDIGVHIREQKNTIKQDSKASNKKKISEKQKPNKKESASTISDAQIKEIANKIFNQKTGRPAKLKTLRKRVNQCKAQYKFTEKDLDSILGKVKDYLIFQNKISISADGKEIIWV